MLEPHTLIIIHTLTLFMRCYHSSQVIIIQDNIADLHSKHSLQRVFSQFVVFNKIIYSRLYTLYVTIYSSAYMHTGEPRRKRDIELLCICTDSYMCLHRSASRHCCLQESSSAQWCHCTHRLTMIRAQLHRQRQQQPEADRCRHE